MFMKVSARFSFSKNCHVIPLLFKQAMKQSIDKPTAGGLFKVQWLGCFVQFVKFIKIVIFLGDSISPLLHLH